MKKAINIWSFPPDMALEEKLRLAKSAGFEGFEIDLSEDGPVNLSSSSRELGAVRALADRIGIRLMGLATGENVWNKFLLSPLEMAKFVGQFDHPRVAAYFDVGNALATGYPEHWIGILKSAIRRVHWKDYRRAVGSVHGFVELLSGDVNWPAVVRGLREIGYSGWVTAELIPPLPFYRFRPEVLIFNTARAMDAILAR